jgi:hypothetical protein
MPHDCMVPIRRFFSVRRAMVQTIIALVLALSVTAQASASVGWCRSDPVVVVNLTLADVFTSAQIEDLGKVTGATRIVIVTPKNVFATLATPGIGFGYGEFVTFEKSSSLQKTFSGIEVIVKVYVPATDSAMPITVDFAPRVVGLLSPMSAEGHANSWIILRSTM